MPLALSWLGHHQLPVADDQPFEVKHHRLQESRELILGRAAGPHPLRALGKDPFIGCSSMPIPPITIPIHGFHIVSSNGREMTVLLGGSLPSESRTIVFIPIDRPLGGADMPEV